MATTQIATVRPTFVNRLKIPHPFFDDPKTVKCLCNRSNPTLIIIRSSESVLSQDIVNFYGKKWVRILSREIGNVKQALMDTTTTDGPHITILEAPNTELIVTFERLAQSLRIRYVIVNTTIPYHKDKLWDETIPIKPKKALLKFLKDNLPLSYGWRFNSKSLDSFISTKLKVMQNFTSGELTVGNGWKWINKNLRLTANIMTLTGKTIQEQFMYMNQIHPHIGQFHKMRVVRLVLTSHSFFAEVEFEDHSPSFLMHKEMKVFKSKAHIPIAYLPWSLEGGEGEAMATVHTDLIKSKGWKNWCQSKIDDDHIHHQKNILIYKLGHPLVLEGVFGPRFVKTFSKKILVLGESTDQKFMCENLVQRHPLSFDFKDYYEEVEGEGGSLTVNDSALLIMDPSNISSFDLVIHLVSKRHQLLTIPPNEVIIDLTAGYHRALCDLEISLLERWFIIEEDVKISNLPCIARSNKGMIPHSDQRST